MLWELDILQSPRTFIEVLPYISYGLSLWAFSTMLVVVIIELGVYRVDNQRKSFTISFGITMLDLEKTASFGFLLAIYLIPVSFNLKLVLMGIDTGAVTKC
jgi:hypothetical protein